VFWQLTGIDVRGREECILQPFAHSATVLRKDNKGNDMKILFCGETFPRAARMLTELLPEEEVIACPSPQVPKVGLKVDVLIPLMHRLETALIQETSACLIQQWGVGLEGVDVLAATARGIRVCNVPADQTANADSTAEHALLLMLGLARRIHQCLRAFQEGAWGFPTGEALIDSTALIVGFGRVGAALARKLRGLGVNVEAIRRTPVPESEREPGIRMGAPADLYDMASQADFVISAAPLTEETRGIFNKQFFSAMKTTAFFINVSRGPLVSETDLVDALKSGTIAGAGLDVFTREPIDPKNPLLSMDNVLCTPHVAGATKQTYEGIAGIVKNNILLVKQGKPPLNCVNEDPLRTSVA
jgi:phosphoglycerate dehydrogenase-like enzyme